MSDPTPWSTADPDTWWSVSGNGFTHALALTLMPETMEPDEPRRMAVIVGPGEMKVIEAGTVTDATPMAIVDNDWVKRTQENAQALNDARQRLDNIESLVDNLNLITLTQDPSKAAEVFDAIRAHLVSSKGGAR